MYYLFIICLTCIEFEPGSVSRGQCKKYSEVINIVPFPNKNKCENAKKILSETISYFVPTQRANLECREL